MACWDKVGLKRGRWTAEEDNILASYIAQHGEGSWGSLPKNTGLQRCGKSCRLRWLNYLKDGVKRGDITEEEDKLIVKLHATYGNRWSIIASHMPGRTDNEIKNHWKSYLSRQILPFRRTYTTDDNTTITIDITTLPMAPTSSRKKKRKKKQASEAKNDAGEALSLSPSHEMVNARFTGIGPSGKTQVDDHLDMEWDRESLVAHLWGEPNHTGGEPHADEVESFMSWLLSNV